MREVKYVGVVTIACRTRSLVRGKTMAEDSLGLVLLQQRNFFDDRISITQSEAFINQSSVLRFFVEDTLWYWSAINKSRPRIRAALD